MKKEIKERIEDYFNIELYDIEEKNGAFYHNGDITINAEDVLLSEIYTKGNNIYIITENMSNGERDSIVININEEAEHCFICGSEEIIDSECQECKSMRELLK